MKCKRGWSACLSVSEKTYSSNIYHPLRGAYNIHTKGSVLRSQRKAWLWDTSTSLQQPCCSTAAHLRAEALIRLKTLQSTASWSISKRLSRGWEREKKIITTSKTFFFPLFYPKRKKGSVHSGGLHHALGFVSHLACRRRERINITSLLILSSVEMLPLPLLMLLSLFDFYSPPLWMCSCRSMCTTNACAPSSLLTKATF